MTSVEERARTHLSRVTNSMTWAAWADALGFITERASPSLIARRTGGSHSVENTVSWTRRVGGKFGVDMHLPAGTYSDDTQLRLATGRAISANGFDAEAFAKIELAVWPSYALGGGRASKAAAANIAKASVPWFANFFDGYFVAGGNGVAMRIQPHIWAARSPRRDRDYLLDVLCNGVITHGHPRALVGAVLYASALGRVMENSEVPTHRDWRDLLAGASDTFNAIGGDEYLDGVWRPHWEEATGESLRAAWDATVTECTEMLLAIRPAAIALERELGDPKHYEHIISDLNLRDPANVGSGTATVCAALALTSALAGHPDLGSSLAANTLGTDTDTIATMAAAILGASVDYGPPGDLQDRAYLEEEAGRLSDVAAGRSSKRFNYPDPLSWSAPKTQVDCVGVVGEQLAIAGLGYVQPDPDLKSASIKDTTWQWVASDFGQTMLVKLRSRPKPLPQGVRPMPTRYVDVTSSPPRRTTQDPLLPEDQLKQRPSMPRSSDAPMTRRPPEREAFAVSAISREVGVDEIVQWVSTKGFSDEAIGFAFRRIAQSGSMEQLIAFAAAVRERVRPPRQ